VPHAGAPLSASLALPLDARGVVVLAHAGQSSRLSAPSRRLARRLERAGIGSLGVDLLTRPEARVDAHTHHLRNDVQKLSRRVIAAIDWLATQPETYRLRIGIYGAGVAAAAALEAAAERPQQVAAIAARAPRLDRVRWPVREVRAPTLFVAGGGLGPPSASQRRAAPVMRGESWIERVEGAERPDVPDPTLEKITRCVTRFLVARLTLPARLHPAVAG